MQIRRLTINDYDDIVRVWADAGLPFKPNGRDSREMMAREMERDHCAIFGLFSGDRMIGVGLAHYDGRRGWINRVAIDSDHRGRNLADLIIAECENFLNAYGEVVICALIEEENTPSMACFENNGFRCERNISYWTKRPRQDL